MLFAIIHRMSGNIVEKHAAESAEKVRDEYLKHHPELECDTVNEMIERYPTLMHNLIAVAIH